MKKGFLAIFLLFITLTSFPKSNVHLFEGSINLVRKTVFDTTNIRIYIKNNLVRVEEFDGKGIQLSSHILDLNEETIYALSPQRKQYIQLSVAPPPNNPGIEMNIIKTGNHREINGFKCYQWRVRDESRNTEIAYWVVEERFEFFKGIISLLNRTEHSLKLFQYIPNNGEYLPILTEERTLLRRMKLQIAVVDIIEDSINPALFEIPRGFKALRAQY